MPTLEYLGVATFPGIKQILWAEMALSHGISPSSCTIRCAPQSGLTIADGPLVFLYGPAGGDPEVELVFANCRIDTSRTQLNSSGFVTTVHILDRRWKWSFGEISGSYNIRFESGFQGEVAAMLDPNLARRPQDLARLLLQAMGETSFNVSQLPNDDYPETHWAHENPAQALAELCESYGCRVVLRLDGSVLLARVGFGGPLPNGGEDTIGVGAKIAATPDAVTVVGGKSRYQDDFPLTPVGLDFDGQILPIDELSYAPEDGWGADAPETFGSLDDTPDNQSQSARSLALKTVYRWFRISAPDVDGNPLRVAGYTGQLTTIRQILPIEEEQVQQATNAVGIAHNLPAWVYGSYSSKSIALASADSTPRLCDVGFSIDRERGIVQMSEPLYIAQAGMDERFAPPTLYLRTAVSVRHARTWGWKSLNITVPTGGQNNTGPEVLRHEEIVYCSIASYDTSSLPPRRLRLQDNTAAVQLEANYYLQAAVLGFQPSTVADKQYVGLLPVNPDGAIQQVTWTVGTSGARTRASLNTEHHIMVPPFRQRVFFEKLKGRVARDLIKQAARQRTAKP